MRRLESLGLVIKMGQTKVDKKFLKVSQKVEGKWEGPRMRWLEDIENDSRELKMKRWRQMENSKIG
jgi:hypothetical protein